jgi:hypothetical protein
MLPVDVDVDAFRTVGISSATPTDNGWNACCSAYSDLVSPVVAFQFIELSSESTDN